MKNQLYILTLLTFFSCSSKEKASQSTSSNSAKASSDTLQPPVTLTNKPASTNEAITRATSWKYERTIDKEGHPVYKASITSPKLLEFDFPYAGGSIATLTIRKKESSTHVYIQVSKGQFNRSFQGGKASVRFDELPPVTYLFSAAANGSANVIFFDAEQALVNKIEAAKKMTVDVDFAGQGKRLIEFRTAGLNWDH